MIGQPRLPERHRARQAHSTVYRRVWDGPARAEAERLERSRPGWVVLYGVGSRRFFAVAAWPVPEPVMVSASTAEELKERMDEAEAEAALFLRLAASGPASVPAGPPVPAATAGPVVAAPERSRHPRPPGGRRRTARPAYGSPYPQEEAGFRPTLLQGSAEDLQSEPARGYPSPCENLPESPF